MAQTKIVISSSGQEFQLPGTAWTTEQVIASFASAVPGLSSMQANVTESGEDKVITFSPRTGTKG